MRLNKCIHALHMNVILDVQGQNHLLHSSIMCSWCPLPWHVLLKVPLPQLMMVLSPHSPSIGDWQSRGCVGKRSLLPILLVSISGFGSMLVFEILKKHQRHFKYPLDVLVRPTMPHSLHLPPSSSVQDSTSPFSDSPCP